MHEFQTENPLLRRTSKLTVPVQGDPSPIPMIQGRSEAFGPSVTISCRRMAPTHSDNDAIPLVRPHGITIPRGQLYRRTPLLHLMRSTYNHAVELFSLTKRDRLATGDAFPSSGACPSPRRRFPPRNASMGTALQRNGLSTLREFGMVSVPPGSESKQMRRAMMAEGCRLVCPFRSHGSFVTCPAHRGLCKQTGSSKNVTSAGRRKKIIEVHSYLQTLNAEDVAPRARGKVSPHTVELSVTVFFVFRRRVLAESARPCLPCILAA